MIVEIIADVWFLFGFILFIILVIIWVINKIGLSNFLGAVVGGIAEAQRENAHTPTPEEKDTVYINGMETDLKTGHVLESSPSGSPTRVLFYGVYYRRDPLTGAFERE